MLCRKAGLVKLGHVARDGTKVQAAASKHKAMSYGRMSEEEARLEAQVRERLARAEALVGPEGGEDFVTDEGLPKHRVRTRPDGTPHPKAQRNFVDPDSRIQESGGSFLQGYNCQLEGLRRGTELYIAPDRQRRGRDPAPADPRPAEELTAKARMRAKLQRPEGRALYARRKAVVEPVNGQIKEARRFRRFLVRGLHAVGGQWSLVCTSHNILKLYRATYAPV